MITGVDIIRGLATMMGMKLIEVPGATGYLDTNYVGKGEAAARALDEYDLVAVHVEAPDEAGHSAMRGRKLKLWNVSMNWSSALYLMRYVDMASGEF